jgi:hypothetical protein
LKIDIRIVEDKAVILNVEESFGERKSSAVKEKVVVWVV